MASLNLEVPGGVMITTPSWKVVNPSREETSGSWHHKGSVVRHTFGEEFKFGGRKIEAIGISSGIYGVKRSTMGLKDDHVGIKVVRQALKTVNAGPVVNVVAFFSIC